MPQDDFAEKHKPLYMISVAAELTGMHPQTLRTYEQKGLIAPGRSRGNTRLYSPADIERLKLISKLTDEGINLAGVVRILDMNDRMEQKDRELDEVKLKLRSLENELHEYQVQERIVALTRYDENAPEHLLRRLLNSGKAGAE